MMCGKPSYPVKTGQCKLSSADLFLPYDIDAVFSAAYALILIDIIRPANELLWDLPQVIELLDEYVARHVAPAQAYRSDLLQLLELHTKIRAVGNASRSQSEDDAISRRNPRLARYAIANSGPTEPSSNPVWSQIRLGNEGSAPTNLETMMSVIDDLNVQDSGNIDHAVLDLGWMWEHDDFWTVT